YEFGESIGHNNTAGTNRYNMPLSLFVAQDNNMQSCIIAQAFVSNETAETYQWVLKMTKKATNNRYLDHLEQNTIEEIWKLSRVTSSKINHFVFFLSNGSYSCTCLLQQKKGLIPRDQRLDVAKEDIYFGQRFGNAITNIDTAPKNIKEYLSRIYIREDELIEEQETSTHTSFNRHTIEDIPLVNPRKVTVKRRPKAASYKNAAKIISQDTGNKKKRGQYTCGFCKEPGHNVATCPNKVE
ncbi:34288_t:CDS:2, partial [Racocetra persica]